MGNRIVISEYDRLLAKYRKVLPLLSLPENPSVPLMAIPQRAETPKLPPIPQLRPPIVSPPVLPTPPQPEIPQLPPIPPPPSIPMGLDQLSAAAQTGIEPIKTTPEGRQLAGQEQQRQANIKKYGVAEPPVDTLSQAPEKHPVRQKQFIGAPTYNVIKGPFGEETIVYKEATPESIKQAEKKRIEDELANVVKMQEQQEKYLNEPVYLPSSEGKGHGQWVTRRIAADMLKTPEQGKAITHQATMEKFSNVPGIAAAQVIGEIGLDALAFPQRLMQQALVGVNPETGQDWTDEELESIFEESGAKTGSGYNVISPKLMTFLWRVSTDPLLVAGGVKPTFNVAKDILQISKAKGWALVKDNIPKISAELARLRGVASEAELKLRGALKTGTSESGQIIATKGMLDRLKKMGIKPSTIDEATIIQKNYPGIIKESGRGLDQAVVTLKEEGFINKAIDDKTAMDELTDILKNKESRVKEPDWDAMTTEEFEKAGAIPEGKPPIPAIPGELEGLANEIKGKSFDQAKRDIVSKVGTVEGKEIIPNDVANSVFSRLQKGAQVGEYTSEQEIMKLGRSAQRLTGDDTIKVYRATGRNNIRPGDFVAGDVHEAGFYTKEGKNIKGFDIPKKDLISLKGSMGGGQEYIYLPKGYKPPEVKNYFNNFTDFYAQATGKVKPPATTPKIGTLRQAETLKTPKPGITTPETGIGQIPPQKPPAPPMPPAGVNPEDEFYNLLKQGKLTEAEAQIKAMPKEKHLTKDTMQQWLDDAKALKEVKPLPTQTIVKIKAPEATGPIRKSQMNLKQYGLDPKDEEILVERLQLDKSTQTWEDTQNWLDTMSSDDIKRIAKSRQEVLPSKEFKAMVQLSSTNTREIARLSEMLKFPSMRKEALKRIGKLKSQLDMALAKSSTSLTEAGRILNLSKMVMKKTFNPDYWVIQARQIAGRDLSTDVVNKIVKLSEAKNGDELAYMLSNLKKGMTDEAILGADLSKELKAIKEERKRLTYPTTPDIDPKKDLQKLSETIRKEYGYPIVEKEALLQDIKTSQQLVTKERNVLIDMALRQEARTRKPAEWLTKATEIAQKPLSPEIRGAIIKAVNTKDGESLRAIIESLTPQTKWDKIANIIGIPRTIMSSVDLSAPFRQGVVMVGRPEFWKSLEPMLKSAFSQKYYDDMITAIKSGSSYNLKKKVGLGLTEMGTKISAREEAFMSQLAEKIPVFGRAIKGSNRAYSAFLNKLRSDVFDTLYQQAIEEGLIKGNILAHTANPDKIIKDISTFINNATGRGELPWGLNESTVLLNSVFFSPRLMASRVNMLGLNPTHYITMHPFVRRQAVTDMIKFAGTGLMTLTLAKLAGANIETDPHSSDFGQIRVGNTRYDIWGGFRPYVVLVARMLPEFAGGGKIKSATTGRERTIGKGYNAPDRLDLLENFLLGKGAPVASLISTFMKGKDFQGKPVNYPAEVMNRFIPMIAQDMYELYKEYGPAGLAMGLPGVFGVGVNTFSRKKNTTIGSDVTGAIDGVQTSTERGETSDYYTLMKEYGGGNGGKSSDSDYDKLLKKYLKK